MLDWPTGGLNSAGWRADSAGTPVVGLLRQPVDQPAEAKLDACTHLGRLYGEGDTRAALGIQIGVRGGLSAGSVVGSSKNSGRWCKISAPWPIAALVEALA